MLEAFREAAQWYGANLGTAVPTTVVGLIVGVKTLTMVRNLDKKHELAKKQVQVAELRARTHGL